MPAKNSPDQSVASILRELDAVRRRVDRASAWIKDGERTMAAAGLAEQVRLLCQEASSLDDPAAAHRLLLQITKHLQDLEMLLGVH